MLKIVKEALNARENAYVPYSKFKVGTAIELKDGSFITGCNVENASYGLTICAERNALTTLINNGYCKNDVVSMAVVADTVDFVTPCGSCRQVMSELLNKDTKVILTNLNNKILETTVSELLPFSFSNEDLK